MDLIKSYAGQDSSEDEFEEGQIPEQEDTRSLVLPAVNLTPQVTTVSQISYKGSTIIDPKTKELMYNPKYEELYRPEVIYFYFITVFFVYCYFYGSNKIFVFKFC